MTATAEPLAADDPTRLGDYELLGRLGAGGMGIVYLGRDPDGQDVAIKVIREEILGDPDYRARFAREFVAASRVDGAFTARVLDADVHAPQPYFVTAYVEGPTLKEAIVSGGTVSGEPLVALAVGIAEAVGAVHGAGIVHRDLKPSNVLLAADGPMVIDFGIAEPLAEFGRTQVERLRGEDDVVLGTPVTMAPERYRGGAVTPAADVFSWGCVVAYAANGRFPFGEGRAYEIGYRVLHEEPDLGNLEGDLRELVAQALAKDPEQRPSVEHVMATLLGEEDPERQRDAAVAFVRRVWPLAGLALAGPVGTSLFGPEPAAPAPAAPPAPPPPPSGPVPTQAPTTAIKRVGQLSKRSLAGKGSGVGQLVVQHKIIAAVVGAAVVAAGVGLAVPRVLAARPADAFKGGSTSTAAGPTTTLAPASITIGPTTSAAGTTVTDPTGTTGAPGTTAPEATLAVSASASAVSASPATFAGTCPTTVTFSSKISVTGGPVTVRFQWVRSSGGVGDRTLRFTGTGAQSRTVQHTWAGIGQPGQRFRGSVTLKLLSPTAAQTAARTVTLDCAPPPPAVHKSGTLAVPQTWLADLDEGALGGSGGDFWFHAVTATERWFEPVGGATVAFTSSLATSPSQCASAPLSTARISIGRLVTGTTLCMRTGAGRYSAITVTGPAGPSPGTLTLRYTTWE